MIPLFPVTSVGVTAGASAGVVDNVAEIRSDDGSVSRRGAVFEGLNATLSFRSQNARGDTLTLFTNARGQYFTRFDGQGSDITGTASITGAGRLRLGAFTQAEVQFSSNISQAISQRTGDGALAQRLDPLSLNTTYTYSDVSATIYQELAKFWRLTASTGVTVTTVIDAPPILLGNGLQLDRRGIDGVAWNNRVSLIRTLDARSSGDVAVTYRKLSAPYSIDAFSVPPRIGPPQDVHQLTLDVGYTRALTDQWQSLSRAGVSATTPAVADPDQRPNVFPVLSQVFNYVEDRYYATIGANLSYSAIVPRLGTGPLFTATAGLAGQPFTERKWKNTVFAFSASATYSSTDSIAGQSYSIFGAGATLEARYPFTRILAAHAGVDSFVSRSDSNQPNVDAIVSVRNTVFVGISGYWSNDGAPIPLNGRTIPR